MSNIYVNMQLINDDMQNNLSSISHVEIFMLHVKVFLLHVDIDKSLANKIMLHVGIHLCIYLVFRGQKYVTVQCLLNN